MLFFSLLKTKTVVGSLFSMNRKMFLLFLDFNLKFVQNEEEALWKNAEAEREVDMPRHVLEASKIGATIPDTKYPEGLRWFKEDEEENLYE